MFPHLCPFELEFKIADEDEIFRKFRRIINRLLTKLALDRIGRISARGLFCMDLAALGLYCQDLGPVRPSCVVNKIHVQFPCRPLQNYNVKYQVLCILRTLSRDGNFFVFLFKIKRLCYIFSLSRFLD